jgi:hypothetical protein
MRSRASRTPTHLTPLQPGRRASRPRFGLAAVAVAALIVLAVAAAMTSLSGLGL